jgi:hypothetical protein
MELAKNVGGRPQKSLSEQQVQEVKTLAGVLSKQQLAAYFGMCENTLNEICKRQPEVFDAYRRGRAETTVQVVSALMDAIQRGDMRAIQFFLKTQAGWTEKRYLEINQSEMEEPEDRTLTLELVGKNADGSQYRYSTDDAGNRIIISHDGSVYAG